LADLQFIAGPWEECRNRHPYIAYVLWGLLHPGIAGDPAGLILGQQVDQVLAHIQYGDLAGLSFPQVIQLLVQVMCIGLDRPCAQTFSGLELKEALNSFCGLQARRSSVHGKILRGPGPSESQTAGLLILPDPAV
jgi:hypothetical protein